MAERRFVTITAAQTSLDDTVIDKLGGSLRGDLLSAGQRVFEHPG